MSSPGDGTSSEPIPQDATTFRADGLREAMIGEETLVLDRSNAQCHVLNSSSSAVWRFMGEELTIGEMVEVLVTETGLDRDFVLTTAEAAVRGFIDAGLVDVIPPTEAIIDRHSAEPEIDPEQFAQDLDAAEHAQRRADRSARRRSWLPTLSRTLDRIPELTVHGPWQFGDSRATIATDSPAVGAYLERILHALTVAPDGAANHTPLRIHIVRRGGGGQERVSTYFDGYRIVRRTPPAEAIEITLRNLNLLATTHTRESILLHAGAVEFDGRVVVVTGESGRGKSTLTAALVLAGGAYLTDELVIIDPQDLSVRPYPKPLDLGPTSLELLGLPAEDGFVVTR